jgi:hypothetical protein
MRNSFNRISIKKKLFYTGQILTDKNYTRDQYDIDSNNRQNMVSLTEKIINDKNFKVTIIYY